MTSFSSPRSRIPCARCFRANEPLLSKHGVSVFKWNHSSFPSLCEFLQKCRWNAMTHLQACCIKHMPCNSRLSKLHMFLYRDRFSTNPGGPSLLQIWTPNRLPCKHEASTSASYSEASMLGFRQTNEMLTISGALFSAKVALHQPMTHPSCGEIYSPVVFPACMFFLKTQAI